MNNQIKQSMQRAFKNYNAPPIKRPNHNSEKPVEKKPEVMPVEKIEIRRYIPAPPQENFVSQERLQEAIIWSEILGKPLSKRRKRR